MLRQMIQIDEKKCNGCGLCAAACHEGAIGMVDGKARLLRDDYCDGLGDCLPVCPTGPSLLYSVKQLLTMKPPYWPGKQQPCATAHPYRRRPAGAAPAAGAAS